MTSHPLPLIGSILLVVVLCLRIFLQRWRHGTWGVALFQSRSLGENLRDGLMIVLFLLLLGQSAIAFASPKSVHIWGDGSPARVIWQTIGAILMFGGIALMLAAQLNLGASWRIGVKDGERPGLVTTGLYRFCRNPIFLALRTYLIGYACLLPTPLSLALLIGEYLGSRLQVAVEEDYLARAYGDAYRDYASRVGRYVPGIGKRRKG
jgi:protein-S-isoprenylcysteine O-methyltransferase Ste14